LREIAGVRATRRHQHEGRYEVKRHEAIEQGERLDPGQLLAQRRVINQAREHARKRLATHDVVRQVCTQAR
jgi:hypothetical protein